MLAVARALNLPTNFGTFTFHESYPQQPLGEKENEPAAEDEAAGIQIIPVFTS
jgi:hypothetical protein